MNRSVADRRHPKSRCRPGPQLNPARRLWSGPAFATGGTLRVSMVTVSGAELRKPSLTMSCAT